MSSELFAGEIKFDGTRSGSISRTTEAVEPQIHYEPDSDDDFDYEDPDEDLYI